MSRDAESDHVEKVNGTLSCQRMVLSGVLRWYLLNAFCLVRILSLISLVAGLRTEQPTENLHALPTGSLFHALLPSTTWTPVTTSDGQKSFVSLRQAVAPDGTTSLSHEDLETAHHGHGAVRHEASTEETERHQSTSEENRAEKGSTEDARHEEASREEETRENNNDTILGKGKTPQELTEEDLHRMTPREGLAALLSQGRDLVAEVKGTLNGIDAVVSLGKATDKIRDEIQKDVQALNRTIVQEFENIEQLRQLQDAQTAVLRSQLSFLMPKRVGLPGQGVGIVKASGERMSVALPGFWYLALLTAFTIEVGASLVFK